MGIITTVAAVWVVLSTSVIAYHPRLQAAHSSQSVSLRHQAWRGQLFSSRVAPSQLSQPSAVAQWHTRRRQRMLSSAYNTDSNIQAIKKLMTTKSSRICFPLLVFTNASLLGLAMAASTMSYFSIFSLAATVGATLSLWQLQILHDACHHTLFSDPRLNDSVLFWGSMPSIFGYYLYLKRGHLTHHRNLGNVDGSKTLFDSDSVDFEDGDVLFTTHRQIIGDGDDGPVINGHSLSVSKFFRGLWRRDSPVLNAMIFGFGFILERFMLATNDAVVALSGTNFFFPKKPREFHRDLAKNTRVQLGLRAILVIFGGLKPLIFLLLSETLWSVPPHPLSAMFVSNHLSKESGPTQSTYAGGIYSLLTLGTNFHTEHHDFPTVPLTELWRLRNLQPDTTIYRREDDSDSIFEILRDSFANPTVYSQLGGKVQRIEGH